MKEEPSFGRPCRQLAHERALLCFSKISIYFNANGSPSRAQAVSITGGKGAERLGSDLPVSIFTPSATATSNAVRRFAGCYQIFSGFAVPATCSNVHEPIEDLKGAPHRALCQNAAITTSNQSRHGCCRQRRHWVHPSA